MLARLKQQLTPPRLLILTYVIGAAIGLVQGLFVARQLGAAGYGIVGVLVTLGGLATNFWDLRLIDLATKLHYAAQNDAARQSATMRMLLLLNAALGLLMALTTTALIWLCWHFFTETAPHTGWVIMQGATLGLAFFMGSAQSMQRLANSFYVFAFSRLAAQFMGLLCVAGTLVFEPSISGYYYGLLGSTLLGLVLALFVLDHVWRQAFGQPLMGPLTRDAWQSYRSELRFVLSANAYSYSKMLTRSGDLLIFSFFASDSMTGVYRLARSLADNLNVFVDAVVQYYNPKLMHLQAEGRQAEFTHIAKRFFKAAVAVTLLVAPAAWIGLELLNSWFLHGNYQGLGLTTALLSLNFVFIAGVHPWLWPALVHTNNTHRMAVHSSIGALTQAGLLAGLCYFVAPYPAFAAFCAVIYYCICYIPLLLWWRRQ